MEITDQNSTQNLITKESEKYRELEHPEATQSKPQNDPIKDASGATMLDDDYMPTTRLLRSKSRKTPKPTQDLTMYEQIPKHLIEEDKLVRKQAASLKKYSKKRRVSFEGFNNDQELVTYPSSIGDLVITMEDYKSLDKSELLMGGILDFYLQYIQQTKMSEEMRERVHICSSFFYNMYAVRPTYQAWRCDSRPAAEKRYCRVVDLPGFKSDENVNMFNKDFIVFPCLDGEHWFLAIACYVKLNGSATVEENVPVDKKYLEKPIKSSIILVFDSIKGGRHQTKAMEHIITFLTTEYNKKYQADFVFLPKKMKKEKVSCPSQRNSTDCGLFVIEFFEHFFIKSPLTDFRSPIDKTNWFHPKIVLEKRKEIAKVIEGLIEQNGPLPLLPPIKFHRTKKKSPEDNAPEDDNISSNREEDKLNNNDVALDLNTKQETEPATEAAEM